MAVEHVLQTYGDLSRKDSVLPLVEILTAKENHLLNKLGKVTATDTIHWSMTDTLRTAATASISEGGDYTYLERTTPARLTNLVQFMAIPFRVTRAQSLSEKYTGQDELARQTTKAIIDWGNAAEFDILRSTLVSGISGTTPKMNKLLTQFRKYAIMGYIKLNKIICPKIDLFVRTVTKPFIPTMTQNFVLVNAGGMVT
jgi:hypothetical protein